MLVTEFSVNDSHGTGVQLRRLLAGQRAVLHVTQAGREGGSFQPSIGLSRVGGKMGAVGALLRRKLASLGWQSPMGARFDTQVVAAEIARFEPNVVVCVVYTNDGLQLAEAVTRAALGLPCLLWFLDLQLTPAPSGRIPELERLLALVTEVWTLSPEMLAWLQAVVPIWPAGAKTGVVPHWCVPRAPAAPKPREVSTEGFRAIMLGNVWDPSIIPEVRAVWRACQAANPGLPPIQWICHEAGIRRSVAAPRDLGPEILWRGTVTDEALYAELSRADLAIVPFSFDVRHGYGRFSVPSKLGELAIAGLPIVVLAGSQTATAKYVAAFGVGALLTEEDRPAWGRRLSDIIQDTTVRARLSDSAIRYAESHLDEERYRSNILLRLDEIGSRRRS